MEPRRSGASPAPKRITVVCNDGDYFVRHRRVIADALCAEGHHVTVMAGGRPIEEAHDWGYRQLAVERFRFHPLKDGKLALAVFGEVIRNRPDILHLITLKPAVFGGLSALAAMAVSGRPKRVVVTIAGLGRLMAPAARTGLARRLTEWTIRRLGKRKEFLFTFETEHDRAAWLEAGLAHPGRTTVIRGAGVDPVIFRPEPANTQPGKLRLLFASRLLKAKGLDIFLQAAEKLAEGGRFEFLVAGLDEPGDPDGVQARDLERNPFVRFLGAVSGMADLIRSADVACLPTRYGEGIPRILIEAAACGRAAIASDLPGCREIVADGETGLIVPAGPPPEALAAFCEAVERYAANPSMLKRHGENARKRFLAEGFSSERVLADFLRILEGERNDEAEARPGAAGSSD